MPTPQPQSPRVCPQCGFSHLRISRAHTWWERTQTWWTRTEWFRCETCRWRGRLHDVWKPDEAFPDLPPLRLGRDLDIDPLQQRDENALVDLVLERADSLKGAIDLWLDDSRPAPPAWLRVTTVHNAKRMLEARLVRELSLDYDLGWCADCVARDEHLTNSGRRHCEHTPTGYDLVQWMAETEHWPTAPPTVHSGNVEGGARMLGMIARYWHELSRQTAHDVERDQVIRTFDAGYAALGERARLLVMTTEDEAPDLVTRYWDDPALLAGRMTDPPAGVAPEELAQRIGWTNWSTLREALASRIGETPVNLTQWNFAKDLVAYLDLISTRGRGLLVRAGHNPVDD